MSKHVRLEDFPRVLGEDMSRLHHKLEDTAYLAAVQNVSVVAQDSPVDSGFYKASHDSKKTKDGGDTFNSAPYAPVLEAGARPHGVSKEGVEAIALWAYRKGYASDWDEAMTIAVGKARDLAINGQEPQWIYKRNLKTMSKNMERLMARTLSGWRP